MPAFVLECTYCGHVWKDYFYSEVVIQNQICPQCKDKNLIAREHESNDIFGYKDKKNSS